jgi:hypothetical protein
VYHPGRASDGAITREDRHARGFHVVTPGLSVRLLDSVRDRYDRICVDYLIDLFAVIDHHEVQVQGTSSRGAVDHSRSGAIRIDAIGPRAWGPLDRGRDAVGDYVIYLRDIAVAVEVRHGQATKRQIGAEDRSFNLASVIAPKGSIRACDCVLAVCSRCGTH